MTPWILQCLCVCLLCVFLSGIMIPQILLVAFRKRLFDSHDERKLHKGEVPRLGGLAFTPVVCASMSLMMGLSLLSFPWLEWVLCFDTRQVAFGFCALLLLYIVGMADDLVGVRYRAKFMAQLIAAVLLVAGGLYFHNLGGLAGLYTPPLWVGIPLTLLLVVYVINSINLIDGIDGLASGLSMVAFLLYGVAFGLLGDREYAMLSFACLGVLLPFFYYNVFGNVRKRRKIFMGDTGALTIGLLLCFLGLALLRSAEGSESLPTNPMVLVMAPLLIPCLDVARVFAVRILHRGNPFMPDRTHIHHKILALGIGQRAAMMAIVGGGILFAVANIVLGAFMSVDLLLLLDILCWAAVNLLLTRLINRRK